MNSENQAAEVFPPGEFIREELEARGWTQADLAAIIKSSARLVNEIVAGKRSVTPETAHRLGQAFGTSAELWLGLESDYQLAKSDAPDKSIAKRAQLYDRAPITEMVRRGWIERSGDVDYLDRQVRAFLRIKSLADPMKLQGVAARAGQGLTTAQEAWFCRARQMASAVTAEAFSMKKLDSALADMRGLLQDPESVRHIPRILAGAGVRFVVIEHTKGSRIDGAALWLDKKTPLVALSMRHDKLDSFWHTLIHELGHIRLKHTSLDVNLVGPGADQELQSEAEREANLFAVEFLVPQDALSDFVARVHPLYSKVKVQGFAALHEVHPSLVLGQLKHRGKIRWQNFAPLHPRVRGIMTEAGLCDGWGQQLPIWRIE